MNRLVDYLYVALVIAALWGLFRLARAATGRYLRRLEKTRRSPDPPLSRDEVLSRGFIVLLLGLMAMPAATALLALLNDDHLVGGIYLHLAMVSVSVVVFSVVEDLFRLYKTYPRGDGWTVSRHLFRVAPFLIGFWALGAALLSPIFYSALSILLALFYLFALWCRKDELPHDKGESD